MEKPAQEPAAPQTVQCEVCLKRVPRSEARSAEGREYVMYFCGLNCYQKWKGSGQDDVRNDDRGAA